MTRPSQVVETGTLTKDSLTSFLTVMVTLSETTEGSPDVMCEGNWLHYYKMRLFENY